ncbi:hypothetical protein [Ralstonia mannitolilytica]|uniref:hypothetical protein n=1 Tax=Ralstonia mannitolilytica TaxID=105219 RepID=UPI0007B0184C|nr:hypothetical protein [Ralstonia mannitolilytica]ANA32275.1 hypothetical protein VZ52_02060 [Ralstonia mannitolilytica]
MTALRAQTRQTEESLPAVTMGFNSLQSFELMQRGAKLLTASDLVPQQFRGNLANCVIALNMANRIGAEGCGIGPLCEGRIQRAKRFTEIFHGKRRRRHRRNKGSRT